MEKLSIDTKSVDPDRIKEIEEIYHILTKSYDVELATENAIELKNFNAFTNLKELKIAGTVLIGNTNQRCHLTFIKILSTVSVYHGTTSYYNYQVWASMKMSKDFGRMLIRRETLIDKVLNVLHPVEVLFGDPPFDQKFHVVANDQQKAISGLTRGFRNALMDIQMEDFVIETNGNILILGNNNPVTVEYGIYLATFIIKLATI